MYFLLLREYFQLNVAKKMFYFHIRQKHVFNLGHACLVGRTVGLFPCADASPCTAILRHNLHATSPHKCVFVKGNLNLASLSFPLASLSSGRAQLAHKSPF